ncbi:MAG TPA: AraC family transcriptional regulator [Lysobacter sp.]|jgi:AraC family transcriptional regulator|nr:AraC family transcriptional regulator [Lysobacter sp.]
MIDRPACYPTPPTALTSSAGRDRSPLLDVLTAQAPAGLFESPLDDRHILDIHLGNPVQVSCSIDSRERRGLQTHGQFCVVPAGVTGRWRLERPVRALLVRLAPSLFLETANAMGLSSRGAELVPSMHMRDPHIERIGWMLQAEDHDAYPGGRLFTDSLASALAARLLALQSRKGASTTKPGRALPTWRLRHVVEYIEAHLDEDLTLAELARVTGFSLSHFKPLFKQAVGMPVHRFVLERRVERARMRLLEGGSSLTEIALEAGFAHPSHMARCMRRVLGLSPSQVAGMRRPVSTGSGSAHAD